MSHIYNKMSYSPLAVWRTMHGGNIPSAESPVSGGHDINGEPLYIGRAVHASDTIPGKVVPSHGCCYVSYAGHEHSHGQYQILTNPHGSNLGWVNAANGQIPHGALQGGQQSDGEPLFIGRAYHDGSLVLGKVHPSHKVLYVPFGGNEISLRNYEVLVCKEIQL